MKNDAMRVCAYMNGVCVIISTHVIKLRCKDKYTKNTVCQKSPVKVICYYILKSYLLLCAVMTLYDLNSWLQVKLLA